MVIISDKSYNWIKKKGTQGYKINIKSILLKLTQMKHAMYLMKPY